MTYSDPEFNLGPLFLLPLQAEGTRRPALHPLLPPGRPRRGRRGGHPQEGGRGQGAPARQAMAVLAVLQSEGGGPDAIPATPYC